MPWYGWLAIAVAIWCTMLVVAGLWLMPLRWWVSKIGTRKVP